MCCTAVNMFFFYRAVELAMITNSLFLKFGGSLEKGNDGDEMAGASSV